MVYYSIFGEFIDLRFNISPRTLNEVLCTFLHNNLEYVRPQIKMAFNLKREAFFLSFTSIFYSPFLLLSIPCPGLTLGLTFNSLLRCWMS